MKTSVKLLASVLLIAATPALADTTIAVTLEGSQILALGDQGEGQ